MKLVVDASVAVKWTAPEEWCDQALTLLDDTSLLEAPDLIIPEVTNIARKKFLRGEMSRQQAENVAPTIQRFIKVIHPSRGLCERALTMAFALDHPAYDCFYLACAEAIGGVLITADKKLHKAIEDTEFERLVRYLGDPGFSA